MIQFPKEAAKAQIPKRTLNPSTDRAMRNLVGQLIAARVRAGLTQEEVAAKLGTTKSAVSRLERGNLSRPLLTTLENYALVVGCQVEIALKPFNAPP